MELSKKWSALLAPTSLQCLLCPQVVPQQKPKRNEYLLDNFTGTEQETGKWRGERESGQQGEQQQGPGGFGCSLPRSSWQWRWWCFFTILFLWDYIPALTGSAPMTNSHAEGSTMAWKKVPLWWACLPSGKQNERHKQASCRFSVFQWHERLPFICLHRSQTES